MLGWARRWAPICSAYELSDPSAMLECWELVWLQARESLSLRIVVTEIIPEKKESGCPLFLTSLFSNSLTLNMVSCDLLPPAWTHSITVTHMWEGGSFFFIPGGFVITELICCIVVWLISFHLCLLYELLFPHFLNYFRCQLRQRRWSLVPYEWKKEGEQVQACPLSPNPICPQDESTSTFSWKKLVSLILTKTGT